jgi:hypothetical protein
MATFNKEEASAFLELPDTLKSRSQLKGGDQTCIHLDKMCEDAELVLSVKARVFGSASGAIELKACESCGGEIMIQSLLLSDK